MAKPPSNPENKDFWPEWLKPKRLFEFAQNLLKVERSVTTLQIESRNLQDRVEELDMQVKILSEQNERQWQIIQALISKNK